MNLSFKINETTSLVKTKDVFESVFRTGIEKNGFAILDFGADFGSERLRAKMVDLKNELSALCKEYIGQKLDYEWMGRFDQQETTKFHRDNAADFSYLMLGYEPSKVDSKLYFADYSRLIENQNIPIDTYFKGYNPMYMDGEKMLLPYIKEAAPFPKDNYKIVLLNNSKIHTKWGFGIFHKAEVPERINAEQRVINSTMMCLKHIDEEENFSTEQQNDFIKTTKISS